MFLLYFDLYVDFSLHYSVFFLMFRHSLLENSLIGCGLLFYCLSSSMNLNANLYYNIKTTNDFTNFAFGTNF